MSITGSREFQTLHLPLKAFKFNYRGKNIIDHEPLNISNITQVGIQIFGGVHEDFKQSGTSSLELDWIRAVSP